MISIIIPCYNCEKFLLRAINSVFNQTYKDWEIILINNNSTDQTQTIIDQLVQQHPKKIFGFSEEKKGACHARNLGLAYARGEWIQFLDADDEIAADKLERQLALTTGNAGILVGSFTRIYVEKGYSKQFIVNPKDNIWYALLHSNAGITSANLYLKKAVENVKGWNVQLTSSQEYDLLFRLLQSGITPVYDTILSAHIYEIANSVSRPNRVNGRDEIDKNYLALRLRVAAFLQKNSMWDGPLRNAFAKRLYEMMLNDKNTSLKEADQKMKMLDLDTKSYPQLIQRSKYYIKKLVFSK